MRLVEAVAREVLEPLPHILGFAMANALLYAPVNELSAEDFLNSGLLPCSLLGENLAKDIPLIKRNALPELVSQESNLLLKD